MNAHHASDSSGPSVFDFQRLREVSDGDPEFEREILEEFLHETPETMDRLEAALDDEARSSAQLEAHSVKGGSLSVGAEALGAAAYVLEAALAGDDLAEARPYLESLREEFGRVRTCLRRHLSRAA